MNRRKLAAEQFIQRLKFVKVKDLIHIFIMVPAFAVSLLFRINHRNIWLVCERRNEARDNGYWFFKYLCENHPEIESVYAIDSDSSDFYKVKSLGKVIPFGGFLHWIYYFTAKRNISSQKEGKPNAALCYILEVYLGFTKNRAYIRHGIAKDDQRWVYYDVTKMNLFICSAQREYNFVKERFGYPEGYVKLVGLCRFDHLLSAHETKRQILVMPTMREWLRNITTDTMKYEGTKTVEKSEFFLTWNHFLQSKQLHELLNKYNIDLLFFPHASLQKYIKLFRSNSNRIHIGDAKSYDVQELLMESSILITDYSSIYFDFAYMKKPIIYYQFDYEKYRNGQYQEGYFSYKEDGFGVVSHREYELLLELEQTLCSGDMMPSKYIQRVDDFFTFHDNKNCERTYQAILDMS